MSAPAIATTTFGANTIRVEPELLQYAYPDGHVVQLNNYNLTPYAKFVAFYRVRQSNGSRAYWLACGETDDPAEWQASYGHAYANCDLHFSPVVPREAVA